MNNEIVIPEADLRLFVSDLFEKHGLSRADADLVAGMIVLQEMRGIVTHGLRRIGPNLDGLRGGWMNPSPRRTVLKDEDAIAVFDGDHGVGMLGCHMAMQMAIERARTHGLGMVTVINNNHFLSAAPYCLEAIEQEMIGIACSNTQASMGYPGTAKRVIGNSPIGYGLPTGADFPLIFDSALSSSGGKLVQYIREGRSVPEELAGLDAEGRHSNDPQEILHGGTPMPIGSYKGAGLAILVEVLAGVLSGGAFLSGIVPPEQRSSKYNAESQCCIAIDVGHFMDPECFKERMTCFITDLKSQPLSDGHTEILIPGERAHKSWLLCRQNGVPVPKDVRDDLRRWAVEMGVAIPF